MYCPAEIWLENGIGRMYYEVLGAVFDAVHLLFKTGNPGIEIALYGFESRWEGVLFG